MRAVFINLDAATARRHRTEKHFAETAPAGVPLFRMSAIAAAGDAPDPTKAAEAACFASHVGAIRQHHDERSHLLVLEDDVTLSHRAFEAPSLAAQGWDILFLDVAVGDLRLWSALEQERKSLGARIRFLDLSGFAFASAAAYVVNARSKERVLSALPDKIHRPYDLVLRDLVHAGKLRACLTFPFLTTIAEFSDNTSQIRAPNPLDSLSNAFRRRIFDGVGDGRSAAQLANAAAEALAAKSD